MEIIVKEQISGQHQYDLFLKLRKGAKDSHDTFVAATYLRYVC